MGTPVLGHASQGACLRRSLCCTLHRAQLVTAYALWRAAGLPSMPCSAQAPQRAVLSTAGTPTCPSRYLGHALSSIQGQACLAAMAVPGPVKAERAASGALQPGEGGCNEAGGRGQTCGLGSSGWQQPGWQLVPAGQTIGQCTEGMQAARAWCAGACARHVHIRTHLLTHAVLVEKVAPPAAASAAPSGAACRAQPTVGGAAGCRRACCSAELDQRPVTSLVHAAVAGS